MKAAKTNPHSIVSLDISDEIGLVADIESVLGEIDALETIFDMQSDITKSLTALLGTSILPLYLQGKRRNPFVVPWDVAEMRVWANQTYRQLQDLLDLKQKQASVMETRLARIDSEETAKQGQTIRIFTYVTSFFLPLSFLTSVFSMDTPDLKQVSLHTGPIMAIAPKEGFLSCRE